MRGSPTSSNWLVCARPNPQARLRLFCFPYAGGAPSVYRSWPDELPKTVEMCAVALPGRGRRLQETPATRLQPLVQAIARALYPCLDRPFAVFGHSLGALLGFELVRELRRQYALLPEHLFVSACGAPHSPNRAPPLHTLSDAAFVAELRRLNGTPNEVLEHDELLQVLLPTLRADFALYETYTYHPEPPLDCPIFACGGSQDATVSGERLAAWRDHTSASFVLRWFSGDHFFLHTDRQHLVRQVAAKLDP